MISKLIIFIVFLFKVKSKICCNCKKNNNDNNKEINSEDIEKENDKKIVDIIKNNEIYKTDYKTSKFKWNNNNCTIKTSLLNLMLFFDNCLEIFEDIKKEENIICKRAKKEALEIIKEIIKIREKYLKGENLITMQDFYKRCHDYQYKFYKEVKDDEIYDIDKLKKLNEESIYLPELICFGYNFKDILDNLDNPSQLSNEKDEFVKFRDKDLEKPDYKEYRTDFESGCKFLLIIKLLSKLIKDLKVIDYDTNKIAIIYKGKIFKIESYLNITELDINDKIISITLGVNYGNTGHSCLIFRDKDNKYYFDCCNDIIEINVEDIKNKNFQKILDIWAKKCNSYHYKIRSIGEILYKN